MLNLLDMHKKAKAMIDPYKGNNTKKDIEILERSLIKNSASSGAGPQKATKGRPPAIKVNESNMQ